MNKLSKIAMSPTSFDSSKNYCGEIPDDKWLVVLGRNRDSDILTNCNWKVACEMLNETNSEDVQVFSFGHWACGWIEYLCVNSDNAEKVKIGEGILESIESYPILDEDAFSEAEMSEANEVWQHCYNKKDRVEYIRKHRSQFDFHDFKDLMAVVRGEYFNGYASELIN